MFATESSHSILSIGIETEKREWCVSSMIDERSNVRRILLEKDQSYEGRMTLKSVQGVWVLKKQFDREEKAVIVGR